MENLNRAVIDFAVDQPDTVAIASGLFVETTQESRAFRRQSERDRNHRINWLCNNFGDQCCSVGDSAICTTKFFFSAVAGVVDPGVARLADPADVPAIEAIVVRNSDSRFDGRSTSTPMRCLSGNPFIAEPPSLPATATTSSATVSSRPGAAEIVISLTPNDGRGVSATLAACSSDLVICCRVCASSRDRFGFLLSCRAINQRPMPTLTAMRMINAAHGCVNPARDRQLALQLPVRDQLLFERCAFGRGQSAVEIIEEFIGIHRRCPAKRDARRVDAQRRSRQANSKANRAFSSLLFVRVEIQSLWWPKTVRQRCRRTDAGGAVQRRRLLHAWRFSQFFIVQFY